MRIRRAQERGQGNFGWLKARYTFSFARYYDPHWVGSGPLLVMNEDVVEPHRGFEEHGHENMEILTFVLSGRLTHEDSLGNRAHINAGEFQLMRAGSGIRHAERNEEAEPLHLYQIWIQPKNAGLPPQYEQKDFQGVKNEWQVIADAEGKRGYWIDQDITMKYGIFDIPQELKVNRGWVQVIAGEIEIEGEVLTTSDGVELDGPTSLKTKGPVKLLVFEY